MTTACSVKPANASHRQAGSPHAAPTAPPSAGADRARPGVDGQEHRAHPAQQAAGHVMLWRSVVVVMVQMIGPAPNRKNDSAAT
jgi:hypothetical protein